MAKALTIYQVLEESRDDPDKGPNKPPVKGMWVWWRTGPHPQGVWQAMDARGMTFGKALEENQKTYPVWQDRAHGSHGDWGNYSCHACDYSGDGHPEPGHKTVCDGVCKRLNCVDHTSGGARRHYYTDGILIERDVVRLDEPTEHLNRRVRVSVEVLDE